METSMQEHDYIEKLREYSQSATEIITKAKEEFEKCIVETQQGSSKIIKEWAKDIKNDPEKLEKAYAHAEQIGLLTEYSAALAEGKMHRVCYRTAVVNSYIFSALNQAQTDSAVVDELLNELNNQNGE